LGRMPLVGNQINGNNCLSGRNQDFPVPLGKASLADDDAVLSRNEPHRCRRSASSRAVDFDIGFRRTRRNAKKGSEYVACLHGAAGEVFENQRRVSVNIACEFSALRNGGIFAMEEKKEGCSRKKEDAAGRDGP